jgi:hypothetical protein
MKKVRRYAARTIGDCWFVVNTGTGRAVDGPFPTELAARQRANDFNRAPNAEDRS